MTASARRKSERLGRLGEGLLHLLPARRVVRYLQQRISIHVRRIAAGARTQPRHQLPLQPRIGDLQMQRIRLPACQPAQHLGRQRITNAQNGDEVERLRDQAEHLPIVRPIGDAELPLHRTQRNGGLFSPSFTTMTGVPSVSASEQRFTERSEDTVRQGAAIRGSRVGVDVPWEEVQSSGQGQYHHNAMNRR
jgi:hypothetical protein